MKKLVCTLVILIFILFGCKTLQQAVTETNEPWETQTPKFILTNTPFATASETVTQTSTNTPSLTLSPSLTPQPTYSVEELKIIVNSFLYDNVGCELPCIWGVDPRTVSLQFVKDFGQRFGNHDGIEEGLYSAVDFLPFDESYGYGAGMIFFQLSKKDTQIRTALDYYFNGEGVIQKLNLYSFAVKNIGEGMSQSEPTSYGDPYYQETMNKYLLPQILVQYGKPSKVFILAEPDVVYPFAQRGRYILVLTYEEQGFVIEYEMPKESSGNGVVGCPSKTGSLDLYTWDPKENSLEEITGWNSEGTIGSIRFRWLKPLEEVTDISIYDFYTTYLNPSNQTCIISNYNWP